MKIRKFGNFIDICRQFSFDVNTLTRFSVITSSVTFEIRFDFNDGKSMISRYPSLDVLTKTYNYIVEVLSGKSDEAGDDTEFESPKPIDKSASYYDSINRTDVGETNLSRVPGSGMIMSQMPPDGRLNKVPEKLVSP
jgi:hypothetical protein